MQEQLIGQASDKLQLLYPQLGLSTWSTTLATKEAMAKTLV
jgi:hypothetical protein